MVIEYIKLENFSNIYSSFKSKCIEIDFSKRKNKIVLITGPNGSGKTSILSTLHPFATNGNLDIRDNSSLILKGENGYKEIHISNDGDYYIIKHYYTHKNDTHSVKSYIEKNGEELNENGNVTSFKEIISNELEIEMDYLKLIRLGNNVTNFIDLKSTDRKAFMGQIISEVEVYLKYFKKVTLKMRETKSVISHLLDKIDKLAISDKSDIEKLQKHLKKKMSGMEEEINRLKESLTVVNYNIEGYDSPLIIEESIKTATKTLNKLEKTMSDYNPKWTVDDWKKYIDKLSKEIIKDEATVEIMSNKIQELLNSKNSKLSELDEIDRELSKVSNNSEVNELTTIISNLKNTIEKRAKENGLVDYKPPCTKDELNELLITLDSCNDILDTVYGFGIEPIKKACEYISCGTNISSYISDNNERRIKNKLQATSEYIYNWYTDKYHIPKIDCKDLTCPMLHFYREISELASEIPDVVIEDETFITYSKMAYTNIRTIIDKITEHKLVLSKLPLDIQNMFVLKNMVENITKLKPIYDKKTLFSLMSQVTEYELQQDDLAKLTEYKDRLKLVKKSIGNSDYFSNKRESLVDELSNLSQSIKVLQEEIYALKDNILNKKSKIDELDEFLISLETKKETEDNLMELLNSRNKLKSLNSEKEQITSSLSNLTFEYRKIENEYNSNNIRLSSFIEYSEELSKYRQLYDEMDLVRRSLSSKEGIPLFYQQIYLKDVQEIANNLLDIVYDGDLFIENFEPTADDFKIPFVTKDTSISDVSFASQGERSFISLAISFALINQSISKYNVVLLDEIDATLDTRNREKFIQILETQLDMIDGEQIFLISHNNMFSTYPVDVIDTQNRQSTDNKRVNYIKIQVQ